MRKYLILFLLFTSALFAQNKVVVTTSTPGVNKDSHIIVFSNLSLTVPGTITVSNQFNITTPATQNNHGVRYQEFTNAIASIVVTGGGDVFTTSNNTFVVGKTNILNGEAFTSNLTVRGILNASNANFNGGVVFNGVTDFNSNTLFNGRATFGNSTFVYGPITFTNTATFSNQVNMTVAATANNQLVRYQEFTNFTSTAGGNVFTTSNNTFVVGKTNIFNGEAFTSNLTVRGTLNASNANFSGGVVFGGVTDFNSNTLFNGRATFGNNTFVYGPITFTNTSTFSNQVNMTVAATANNQLVRYQEFTNGLVTGAGDVFTRSNNTFIVTKTNTFNGEVATSNLVVNGTTYLKSSAIIDGTLVVSNVVNFRVSGTGWGYDGTRFLMGTNDGSGNFDYEVRLDPIPTAPDYIRVANFRNSGSTLSLESAGNVQVVIDNNNNDTDRSFIVRKDSTNGATLFSINENGNTTNNNNFFVGGTSELIGSTLLYGPTTFTNTVTFTNQVNMTVAATANNQLVRYQEFTNGLANSFGDVFTQSNNTFTVTKTNTFNGIVNTSNINVNGILTYSNKVGIGNYTYDATLRNLNQVYTNSANRAYVSASVFIDGQSASGGLVQLRSYPQGAGATNVHGAVQLSSSFLSPVPSQFQLSGFINPSYIYIYTNLTGSGMHITNLISHIE